MKLVVEPPILNQRATRAQRFEDLVSTLALRCRVIAALLDTRTRVF